MEIWIKSALCVALALAPVPILARESDRVPRRSGPEILAGVLEHGSNFHPLGSQLVFPETPAGIIYEGDEESGTVDIQLGYRSAPLRFALKPRLTAKLQINTAGRTSFAAVGAEWRQHFLRGRLYGQIGVGLAIHDGYRFTPDPFQPGLSPGEAARRYDLYLSRTSWGSRVLFNPNASLGLRLNDRWAAEFAWEHFSQAGVFSEQNPGIDNLGLRLVYSFGPQR